ncbi:hypothetical protein E2C01_059825 [Portunus trituberculatus]|uniref:Uncharacterized protein n=1 Tax=Portunus trituberculatus TaxID=210409 RepID=A0A5B7H0L6_PORTR|nr:hypothetical protein [Portunus trituberculatus]
MGRPPSPHKKQVEGPNSAAAAASTLAIILRRPPQCPFLRRRCRCCRVSRRLPPHKPHRTSPLFLLTVRHNIQQYTRRVLFIVLG